MQTDSQTSTTYQQSPVAQQMPVSQNQQMQAAYNQQMGYQAPIQQAPVTPVAPVQSIWKIKMADKGLFFTKLGAFLLTILTLGIAKPWADSMVINKWASNLVIDGRTVRYSGTGMELFGIWIKVFLLSIVTIGIYYLFWGRNAVNKYIDSRLSWN